MAETYTTQTEERLAALEAAARPDWDADARGAIVAALLGWAVTGWMVYIIWGLDDFSPWPLVGLLCAGAAEIAAAAFGAVAVCRAERHDVGAAFWGCVLIGVGGLWLAVLLAGGAFFTLFVAVGAAAGA